MSLNPPTSGRDATSLALSRHAYPDPFLDYASTVLPKSYQKLLELCRVFAMTHAQIAPVVRKYARYPLTHVIIREAASEEVRDWWKTTLNEKVKMTAFAESMGLDFFTYGTAYVTAFRPFNRSYECVNCKKHHPVATDPIKYRLTKDKVFGKCPTCNVDSELIPHDNYTSSVENFRLVRLSPMEMTPKKNQMTGEVIFYSSPPAQIKRAVKVPPLDREIIDGTPWEIVKAALKQSKIKWAPGAILHVFEPAPSGVDYEFGMPRVLPALKRSYLDALYLKADESGALERSLPARFVFPQPSTNNPFKTISLADFSRFMRRSLNQWRRDKNAIMTSPFAIGVAEIGNDAAQYNTTPMRQQAIREIIGAMGAPEGFLSDAMNWTGGSVQLRMLENDLLPYVNACNELVTFAIREISVVTGREVVKGCFKPFRTIDDVQITQMIFNMANSGKVSWHELLDRLNLDYDEQYKMIRKEIDLDGDLDAMRMANQVRGLMKQMSIQNAAQSGAASWDKMRGETQEFADQTGAHLTRERLYGQSLEAKDQQDQQMSQEQQEQQELEKEQQRLEVEKVRASVDESKAKGSKLHSESDKLQEHAEFYTDQRDRRDDGDKAQAVVTYAKKMLEMRPPEQQRYLGQLMQIDENFAHMVKEEFDSMSARAQSGEDVTEDTQQITIDSIRATSKNMDEIANKIIMQSPNTRSKLLSQLISQDPLIGMKVMKIVRSTFYPDKRQGGIEIKPLPEKLPPRRTT